MVPNPFYELKGGILANRIDESPRTYAKKQFTPQLNNKSKKLF